MRKTKELIVMILFTLLAMIIGMFVVGALIAILSGGFAVAVVFGDVIVCMVLVALLVKWFVKKKK